WLQEYNGDTAKDKDANRQVKVVVSNKHGLLGNAPSYGAIGRFRGVRHRIAFAYKALYDLLPPLNECRIIWVNIGDQIAPHGGRFDMDEGREDRDTERSTQLPHHIVQTGTLSHLLRRKILQGKGRQRNEKDGHPDTPYDERPEEITRSRLQRRIGQHPGKDEEQDESACRHEL